MKSSMSVGPRSPDLSEFWLSATGTHLVGGKHPAAGIGAHAVERQVARVQAQPDLAGLFGGIRLGQGAAGRSGVLRLDRLAALRLGRKLAVLAFLVLVVRHRRRERLDGVDLGDERVGELAARLAGGAAYCRACAGLGG
jgi:hypothetical protein